MLIKVFSSKSKTHQLSEKADVSSDSSGMKRRLAAKLRMKSRVLSAGDPYEPLLRAVRRRFSEIAEEEVKVSSIGILSSLHYSNANLKRLVFKRAGFFEKIQDMTSNHVQSYVFFNSHAANIDKGVAHAAQCRID